MTTSSAVKYARPELLQGEVYQAEATGRLLVADSGLALTTDSLRAACLAAAEKLEKIGGESSRWAGKYRTVAYRVLAA